MHSPLQVEKYNYWLSFYDWNLDNLPTWLGLFRMLTLVEYCYVAKGHDEEFHGQFRAGDGVEIVASVKLTYQRSPAASV